MEAMSNTDIETKVYIINSLRKIIHQASPFKSEPVDFVEWVIADDVMANDYNPNSVAPPEMELLRTSIKAERKNTTQSVDSEDDTQGLFNV